jgi:hypothetical protein
MKKHNALINGIVAVLLLAATSAFGHQLGMRYSGKSWDCIPMSGKDYFVVPFRDSRPMQGGAGPSVMWNNYPVMCQAIPARKVAGSRAMSDPAQVLQAYGERETKYQAKQGAECGPVKIVRLGGNDWGTMTIRNRLMTNRGSFEARIYSAWTLVGDTLLITTIQADGSRSLDTGKNYLNSCLAKLRKFPHRVHFEDFLRGQ